MRRTRLWIIPFVLVLMMIPFGGGAVHGQGSLTNYLPLVTFAGETTSGAVTHVVQIGPGLTFTPSLVEIQVGDTVRWEWAEAFHTVNSGVNGVPDNQFCSPNNQDCANNPTSPMGAVYEKQFNTADTFPYFCRIHPGMTGEVVVLP